MKVRFFGKITGLYLCDFCGGNYRELVNKTLSMYILTSNNGNHTQYITFCNEACFNCFLLVHNVHS
jgi:hypothetical protein